MVDEASAAAAADALVALGAAAAVVTLGSRGAYFVGADGDRGPVPAFDVVPIDCVGAGDVFNGALGVALGEGLELRAAVEFASAAAAISVTRRGAQPSAPRRHEIDAMMRGAGRG